MDKKSVDILENINKKSEDFLVYLNNRLGIETNKFLNELSSFSGVLIFSGIIRNFFIKHNENLRDFDLVVDCDEFLIETYLQNFKYRKNSFGGYKIVIDNLSIDLWHIEKTWAYHNYKIQLELFKNYSLPSTAFFNFSSIIYDYNHRDFIFTSNFKNFLETKEIDLVLEKNPLPELCVVNTIYYKNKFRLNVSNNLKKYCLTHFSKYTEDEYINTQKKHFNKILYEYSYLKEYIKIFENELKQEEEWLPLK